MQNVSASKSEGYEVMKSYRDLGLINSSIDFIIPVYENMPEKACSEPVEAGIVTQNVKIKGTNVNVRSGASTSASILATVNTGDVLLRIEMATSASGGYYWDKVVLSDGRKGYISRSYLVEMADVKNCNNSVVANTSANLRNGPGTEGTTIITTLVKGQALTRIETGVYNLNGFIWDRVVLSDGRQGYVAQNYIDLVDSNSGNSNTGELIKVITSSGLKVREQPGTNQKVLTYLDKGDILTRTQSAVSTVNGYTWDKIVTSAGIEGYIARGNSTETYIEVVTSNEPNGNNNGTNAKGEFKIENGNVISNPLLTVEDINDKYSDTTVTVKKPDGTVITGGNVGTGYSITIGSTTYTAIKLGDVNGDGEVNTIDALNALKYDVGSLTLSDAQKKALDVNKDGELNTLDALYLLKYDVGLQEISL